MFRAVRFGALCGVRHAAHHLGDYWAQTMQQSNTKGAPGRKGMAACARHVSVYTLLNLGAVVLANRVLDLKLSARAIVAGELVSLVTHYGADRREHGPLYALADLLESTTGKATYLRGGGAADLDQAWHHVCNALAAGVTAATD